MLYVYDESSWEITDPHDRREFPRYQLRLPVNICMVHRRRWSTGVLIDLSAGGLQLRTRARLAVGNTVGLRLLDYERRPYEMEAMVVRTPCIPIPGGLVMRFRAKTTGLESLFEQARELPEPDRAAFLAAELRPHVELERRRG